ncbi:porin family protein [Paucihalobacter sp.]|uniref:porin family protein n=1 Tax=Paucihalobacter sp. TaxID=2850405 RepID=UPI002FE18BEC
MQFINKITDTLKHQMRNGIVLAVVLGSVFLMNAQESTTYGLKMGVNSTNVFASFPDDMSRKTGFHIASFVRFHITEELIYFQTELGYSRKGSEVNFGLNAYDLNLDYLEVPLLLSIGKKNMSFVEIGGYMSYLINSNVSNTISPSSTNLDPSDLNNFDYGLSLGLNFNYEQYTIGARYHYGLADLGNGSMKDLLGEQSRNRSFQIYVSYSWLK